MTKFLNISNHHPFAAFIVAAVCGFMIGNLNQHGIFGNLILAYSMFTFAAIIWALKTGELYVTIRSARGSHRWIGSEPIMHEDSPGEFRVQLLIHMVFGCVILMLGWTEPWLKAN